MHFYACWFLADIEDAAAIRTIATTRERKVEEWPHLILAGVDGDDLNKLERRARPKRKGRSRAGGKILDKSKMTAEPFTCVSHVEPEFVQSLAALDGTRLKELAAEWSASIERVTEQAAAKLLGDMAAFARQAERAGKPVLQLDVL